MIEQVYNTVTGETYFRAICGECSCRRVFSTFSLDATVETMRDIGWRVASCRISGTRYLCPGCAICPVSP